MFNHTKFTDCLWAAMLFLILTIPTCVFGLEWVGENGVFRISFSPIDPYLSEIAFSGIDDISNVSFFVWLSDVDEVECNGERLMFIGGVEFVLDISGANYQILSVSYPQKAAAFPVDDGLIFSGFDPGIRLVDGSAMVCEVRIAFMDIMDDIFIQLAPGVLRSCQDTPNCPEDDPRGLYVGIDVGDQINHLFGAGCVGGGIVESVGSNQLTPIMGTHYSVIGRYIKISK